MLGIIVAQYGKRKEMQIKNWLIRLKNYIGISWNIVVGNN